MLCAFDIETDTSGGGGLDPSSAGIVSIAAACDDGDTYFDTADRNVWDESRLLVEFDWWLGDKAPDMLLTWNGAVFDGPFIHRRAEILHVPIGLRLTLNPAIIPKYEPCPGFDGGYDLDWHHVPHRDVAYEWREWCETNDVRWSLKSCAAALSIPILEVDRERIHRLTYDQLRAYNLSDAQVTLALAQRVPSAARVQR